MKKFAWLLVAGMAILIVGTTIVGLKIGLEPGDIAFFVVFGLFPFAKLPLGLLMQHGSVVQKAAGRPIYGGLHVVAWIIVGVLVALSATILFLGLSNPELRRAAILGGEWLFATLWCVFIWFAALERSARFLSEYDLRVALARDGYTKDRIEHIIWNCKLRGLIQIPDDA